MYYSSFEKDGEVGWTKRGHWPDLIARGYKGVREAKRWM